MTTLEATVPVVRSFRSHPSSLYQVRQFIRSQASTAALSQPTTDDVLLATSEACVNSVLHSSSRTVRVTWRSSEGCVEVQVSDEGVFQRRVPLAEFDQTGGRGILLMTAVMDEVSIHEGTPRSPGTVVRLVKCEQG
jgi:anti-sigma regulatory factor (Ser/Thr protein kinase)